MFWSLRDELLLLAQRWYMMVAFCLAGAALGLGLAWLWPSPYRAVRELYVGLNVISAVPGGRAPAAGEPVFSNVNDYKNWQMASLNTIVYSDAILDATLAHLQGVHPDWQNVSREQLAGMLHVYWRNAGKWRLAAQHVQPERAIEAVVTWQDVLIEQVHAAIAQAGQAVALAGQIQALDSLPPAERTARQDEYAALSWQFTLAVQASQGLSPELLVQKLSRTRVDLDPVRPTGVAMLVGALLGWVAWGLWWLVAASRRAAARHLPAAVAAEAQL